MPRSLGQSIIVLLLSHCLLVCSNLPRMAMVTLLSPNYSTTARIWDGRGNCGNMEWTCKWICGFIWEIACTNSEVVPFPRVMIFTLFDTLSKLFSHDPLWWKLTVTGFHFLFSLLCISSLLIVSNLIHLIPILVET